ncbi:MAG: Transcription factor fapR [Thermoanaerobacterales bacterium 50_218]|nr:MAG: Transcription factor fapR [Thermoanaerobacterales bacterium 50_218]HAA90193.1 transcription factor FapR [Peptococcaceae bacterium]
MAGKRTKAKVERQQQLAAYLQENPFLTDEELAEMLGVSVPTIRLDRLEMGIPELRVRTKEVAEKYYSRIRSLGAGELIGELVEIEIGKRGISILEVDQGMVFAKTKILRGHYLFAQANSLAVALVSSEVALTGSARVRFLQPVYLGHRVTAFAEVVTRKGNSYLVAVRSRVGSDEVFRGQFIIVAKELSEL